MKKTILVFSCLTTALSSHAQGNFNFNNINSSGNITIAQSYIVPDEGTPGNFAGTGYTASLFWGPSTATSYADLTLFAGANTVFFGNGIADPN